QNYLEQITTALAVLSRKVEISSSLGFTDINICAENFYRDLLNMSLGYSLNNINAINPNAAAIDLGDLENKIAIQVTSTSAITKTRTTVAKFIEQELYNNYERLIIFNLVSVTRHKDPLIGDDKYQINTKDDIWDRVDFARLINDKQTEDLKKIANFLHKELNITPNNKLPKEVQTIITLIDHISNCEQLDANKVYSNEPDPKGKIYQRFSDHSDFLTNQYKELYAIYGQLIATITEESDISTTQIKKLSLYLQTYSDNVLTECGGDPQIALNMLTSHFAKIIGAKGIEYDATAISYFLVDEIIRCNVFPNEKNIND
ncbi:SMEK domain-containing protein, partial [Gammaproteobacteria bacterium]|nr:SMEK domain-containing protein [Gammaproteobacteria bacterium]